MTPPTPDFLNVEMRKKIARLYDKCFYGVDWIIPQKVDDNLTNSYWTYAVRYLGEEALGLSWESFYAKVKENGGDGFFGGLANQNEEIVMKNKPFYGGYIESSSILFEGKFDYENEEWPIAEKIQPQLMQFKTGYRDIREAEIYINAINKTIRSIKVQW